MGVVWLACAAVSGSGYCLLATLLRLALRLIGETLPFQACLAIVITATCALGALWMRAEIRHTAS
ncbi:hypothetical protein [Bifidobacterium xylocopae]|uniref:hypothetical protein n=1 Tax=Bifidobacterium xylocopae TaxID=2493119 RepID=UPI000FDEFBE7|nr:hypothetical protein [Bifidobacterium xylocopae]